MAGDPKVGEILRQLQLAQYVAAFAENAIDEELLPGLTDTDLKELGVAALGHRKRMLAAFARRDSRIPLPTRSDGLVEEELKIVTVFFADIAGSTTRIQGLDPEDAAALLRPYVEIASTAVRSHGGTVLQELGDGLFAVFGAPVAVEDHAIRACHAALQMQAAVERTSAERPTRDPLQMRVGLHSGEVVVSNNGQDLRVSGPAVHLAARMEQSAQPGRVQLSRATRDMVDDSFALTDPTLVLAKGFEQPVEAYGLIAALEPHLRMERMRRRQLAPLVGREREFKQLTDAALAAHLGRGSIAAIAGPAGIGKSRLIYEFTAAPSLAEFRLLRGSARPDEAERAFGVIIEIVKDCLGIEQGGVDAWAHRAGEALHEISIANPKAGPALRALLGLPVEGAAWPALDSNERQVRITDAVIALLAHLASRQPLVAIVEDLHWADDGSRAVLTGLANVLGRHRLLLVVTYRPEYVDPWVNLDGHLLVKLPALTDESIARLLEVLIGTDPSVQPLKDLLKSTTGGNPLFIEESARGIRDSGAMESVVSGSFRLTRSVAEIEVPRSIQSMIAARVDSRTPREREVLQAAAVLGTTFGLHALATLLDSDEAELASTLVTLQRADFIFEAGRNPDPEYQFKHALTRDTVYRQLLKSRRRELHRRILDNLEGALPTGAESDVEMLAYHAYHAEAWERCLAYCRQAANRSWLGLMERLTAKYLEWAIVCIEKLDPSLENRRTAIDLRLDLRAPLNGTGQIDRLEAVMIEARDLAGSLNDKWRQAAATGHLGLALWRAGKFDAAESEGRAALKHAEDLDDDPLRALAWFRMGQARHGRGDYAGAVDAFERSTSFAPEGRSSLGLASWRAAASGPTFLAWSLVEIGQYERATQIAGEMRNRAQSLKDRYNQEMACFVLGLSALRQDRLHEALAEVSDAVAERLKLADAGYLAWTGSVAGLAQAKNGEFEAAFSTFNHAIRIAGRNRALQYQFPFVFLGEAYLLAGRLEEAKTCLEETLEWCRRRGEHGTERKCLNILGGSLR